MTTTADVLAAIDELRADLTHHRQLEGDEVDVRTPSGWSAMEDRLAAIRALLTTVDNPVDSGSDDDSARIIYRDPLDRWNITVGPYGMVRVISADGDRISLGVIKGGPFTINAPDGYLAVQPRSANEIRVTVLKD